jgi:hypothetical protein
VLIGVNLMDGIQIIILNIFHLAII